MTDQHDDARTSIGRLLGRLPSGVFILTAADNSGHETGMLASWVQQASFDPPAVTVAINKERYLNAWLAERPLVVLNIIAEKRPALVKHFAKGFAPDESAFDGVHTTRAASGLPILTDALGYLEGEVTASLDAGDHMVYVVRISGAGAGDESSLPQPMVHIRKNGFSY